MLKRASRLVCLAMATSVSAALVRRGDECESDDDGAMLALRSRKNNTRATHSGFGSTLVRGTEEFPSNQRELVQQGWHMHNDLCDPVLGYAWTQDASGVTESSPHIMYTTKGGQFQGLGVAYAGGLPDSQEQWATKDPLVSNGGIPSCRIIDVAFRTGEIVCSGETTSVTIGDQALIVNPAGDTKMIPMLEDDAETHGFQKGACLKYMGWHWVSLGGNASVTKDNFFPLVPMYWDGKLNALFFSSFTVQQTQNGTEWQSNGWDPSPIPMCNNMCDKNCVLEPLGMASTMHWFFHPSTELANVICPSSLYCRYPEYCCCSEEMPVPPVP